MKNNNTNEKLYKQITLYRVVLSILILVLIVLIIFFRPKTKATYYRENNDSLIDPTRRFSEASNYIVNIESLREYLHKIELQYPDSVSIYYEQINSGANISINKDVRLFPASLSKLVQGILIVKKVEDGQLSWQTRLKTDPKDISSDSGDLYKTIGTQSLTVEELLSELIVNSDNTAQNIFKHSLDVDDYIDFQYNTGLQDLYNENGFISAKEYTRILRVLYGSTYLSMDNSEKILEHMSKSTFHEYLSQGIPKEVVFAHKYGENIKYNIFADSGIVYVPGKPYLITVILKGKDSSPETYTWAKNLMKEISEKAYTVSK